MTIKEAIQHYGWKAYQFNFIDGTKKRIISFIDPDPHKPAITFLIKDGTISVRINDEENGFSYQNFFEKEFIPPIEDVTEWYIN